MSPVLSCDESSLWQANQQWGGGRIATLSSKNVCQVLFFMRYLPKCCTNDTHLRGRSRFVTVWHKLLTFGTLQIMGKRITPSGYPHMNPKQEFTLPHHAWTQATHKCVVQMSHTTEKRQKYLNFLLLDYSGLHDSYKIVVFSVLQIWKNVPIV